MAGTKFALPNTTQKRMEMLERVAKANVWESAVHQRDCIANMLMFARTDIYAAVHGSDCPHQLEVHAVLQIKRMLHLWADVAAAKRNLEIRLCSHFNCLSLLLSIRTFICGKHDILYFNSFYFHQ